MKQPILNIAKQIAQAARDPDCNPTDQLPKSAAMDNKKPIPLPRHDKPRHVCSVCGKSSYSIGGIHPQCAEKQADAQRVEGEKAAKTAENPKEKVAKSNAPNLWQKKVCPKCHTNSHARKLTCDCGHQFSPTGSA